PRRRAEIASARAARALDQWRVGDPDGQRGDAPPERRHRAVAKRRADGRRAAGARERWRRCPSEPRSRKTRDRSTPERGTSTVSERTRWYARSEFAGHPGSRGHALLAAPARGQEST